jgi:hypothetical protein
MGFDLCYDFKIKERQRQMNAKQIALGIIVISFAFLALALLTGCTTLGISLETQYGRFTYELPEPIGTKK